MSGLKKATDQVCNYLAGCMDENIISFSQSFEYKKAPMPADSCRAYVGIAGAEYKDFAPMESEAGLCKTLQLTMRIEIIIPKVQGGNKARQLFDKIAGALFASDFGIRKISSGEIKFDAKLQALTLEALADIEFMVVLEDTQYRELHGYQLRREVLV